MTDLTPTQADRDRAADAHLARGLPRSEASAIRRGEQDDHWLVQEFAAHRLAAEQSLRAEIEKLHQFRDAMVTLSICDAFGGTLRGFCERDEDDEDHDEAWEIAANVIQPIVIAEDIAAGRYSWVADEDESND